MSGATLGHVLLPVADVNASAAFFERAFGLATKFVDGDRYAALDGGGATLALAASEEQVRAGAISVGLKVEDVDAASAQAVEAGGRLLGELIETDHDRRQAIADPDGNIVVVYAPRR